MVNLTALADLPAASVVYPASIPPDLEISGLSLTIFIKKEAYLYADDTDNPFCRDINIHCSHRKGADTLIFWVNGSACLQTF
jgi:hypothetical protein